MTSKTNKSSKNMLYNLKIKQEPPDEQPFSPSSQTTGILLYTFLLLKKIIVFTSTHVFSLKICRNFNIFSVSVVFSDLLCEIEIAVEFFQRDFLNLLYSSLKIL